MTYIFQYWVEPQTGRLLTADGRDGLSFGTLHYGGWRGSQAPVTPSSPSSFPWCDLDFGDSDYSDKNRLESDEEGATGSQEAS